ncbi:MAG: hypothetical protein H0W13_11370, partial [Nitrospirales bacterium]|nr:hypothetical protein [Nitrospirales bacterium]
MVFIVAHSGSTAGGEGLARTFIDKRLTAWTGLPQVALVAFGATLCFVLIRFSMTRHPVESGFLWTLVAVFLALHAGPVRDSLLY